MTDTLQDFATSSLHATTAETRDVYRKGTGPGVIVIHEMPGHHAPRRRLRARGWPRPGITAVLPSLFGTPGPVAVSVAYVAPVDGRRVRLARVRDVGDRTRPVAGHRSGSGPWPGRCTRSAAGRASARSACASPAASPWR